MKRTGSRASRFSLMMSIGPSNWPLLFRPEQGPLIPRSGGLRKLRWKRSGGGKPAVFG